MFKGEQQGQHDQKRVNNKRVEGGDGGQIDLQLYTQYADSLCSLSTVNCKSWHLLWFCSPLPPEPHTVLGMW